MDEQNKKEEEITFDEVVKEGAIIILEWVGVIAKIAKKLL